MVLIENTCPNSDPNNKIKVEYGIYPDDGVYLRTGNGDSLFFGIGGPCENTTVTYNFCVTRLSNNNNITCCTTATFNYKCFPPIITRDILHTCISSPGLVGGIIKVKVGLNRFSDSALKVSVIDSLGNELMVINNAVPLDTINIFYPTMNLPAGDYFVLIQIEDDVY